jgi:hypothetical protein
MRATTVLFSAMLIAPAAVLATEVRVVGVLVVPEDNPPPCVALTSWSSQITFHNTTSIPQTVALLGISNGSIRPDARSLQLSAGQTVSLYPGNPQLNWEPVPFSPRFGLWVNRLDVPTGVIVGNRLVVSISEPPAGTDIGHLPCQRTQTLYAGLSLPVVSTLIQPGVTQYFLGTNVGGTVAGFGFGRTPGTEVAAGADEVRAGTSTTDARLNVGVYNAGTSPATARVRVYCTEIGSLTLGDSLLQTSDFVIAPNSVTQQTVLASAAAAGCQYGESGFWYATATVDQPSFAYAIGLANGTLPKFPGTVASAATGQ